MLRGASQVTFVKKTYTKYYFIFENIVEWAIEMLASQM